MRHTMIVLWCALFLVSYNGCQEPPEEVMRNISLTELEDRIRGCWAGQMIGVTFGCPTEFRYLHNII